MITNVQTGMRAFNKYPFLDSILLTIFLYTSGCSTQLPVLPKKGNNIEQFISQGWKVIKKSEGDLNKDGLIDIACVIQKTDKKFISTIDGTVFDSNPRILFVVFKENDSSYSLRLQSDSFIVRHTNSAMEDPFSNIKIDRGVLKISFSIFMNMGSWETSTYVYTFRYQNDEFTLIGADYDQYNRGTEAGTSYSINFSTRKLIRTAKVPGEKTDLIEKTFELSELKTIKSFDRPFTWTFEGIVL